MRDKMEEGVSRMLWLTGVGGYPAITPDIGRDRKPRSKEGIINAWLDGGIGSEELLEVIESERGLGDGQGRG